MGPVCSEDISAGNASGAFLQTVCVTVLVTCAFVVSKTTYDRVRRLRARATVVVVGAGPVGLTAGLIAAKSGRATRIIIYEERSRKTLHNRPQQIALDHKNVVFLNSIGVDFDNIEGCWQQRCFYTRLGVFQEYMLSIVQQLHVPIDVRLGTKFARETVKELESIPGRLVVVACDGSAGRSASILGLSDEFIHHSCRAYGACAGVERLHESCVPTPEIRFHNLTFDLHAYGNSVDDASPQGFHLKLFGSLRNRYMALAVPKCESKLVKTLKIALDQSIMRSIFHVCFNTFKTDGESAITDVEAVTSIKFSPRLFEIKLAQRMENVAFIQESNLFITSEGDAARCLNFHSGCGINLALRGLYSLEHFIKICVAAESEKSILHALRYKHSHGRSIVQEFLKGGLREIMYA